MERDVYIDVLYGVAQIEHKPWVEARLKCISELYYTILRQNDMLLF